MRMTSCSRAPQHQFYAPAPRRAAPSLATIVAVATFTTPGAARAQLRPLDPLDWSALRSDVTTSGWIGAGRFADQRASLAGVQGRLTEAGNFLVAWRTGRVLLEAGGTVQRTFRDDSVYRGALPGVRGDRGPGVRRSGSGDYRVFTTVLLTPPTSSVRAATRFGTRLPTTDNRNGLDRDLTDFYGLIDLGYTRGPFDAALETGIGIVGTRFEDYEQADIVQYAGTLSYRIGALTPSVMLLGQATTADFQAFGTENLAEVRPTVQLGARRWVRVAGVFGLARHSPSRGVLVSAGLRR